MSNRQIALVVAVAYAADCNRVLNAVFNDSGDNLHAGVRASATGADPATHYFTEAHLPETVYEALHDLKDTNICPARYRGELSESAANAAVTALQIYPMQSAAEALQSAGLAQILDES